MAYELLPDISWAEQALGNPNVQRFLNTVALAEGTAKPGVDPYRVNFGGSVMDDLSAHPNVRREFTQSDGKTNYTTAAGKYQFLKGTWDDVAGKLGLSDFSPRSQDLAAVQLLKQNGSLDALLAGDMATAVQRSGKTWASLPSSPYAQPKRSQSFIEKALGAVIPSAQAQDKPMQGRYELLDNAAPGAAVGRFELLDEPAEAGKPREPAPQSSGLARQLGLTARYGLEGLANAAQLGTEPIRYITDRLTGQTGKTKPLGALATDFADWAGLPTPQSSTERIIGDASRLVAGAGGMAGGASAASNVTRGAAKAVMEGLGSNPLQQLTSAAGAGVAGGQVRESGGSAPAQAVAALVGGVAGGALPGVVSGAANTVRNTSNRTITKLSAPQMDERISQVLEGEGIDFNQLTTGAKAAMRKQMADALNTGKQLDPAAVRRLADFSSVGAIPTRATITRDPVQYTREMNLAKTVANSSDDSLSGLPLIQNRNNNALIGRLNDIGANRGDTLRAGEALSGAVIGRRDALRNAEQQAWDAAKGLPGYTQPIEKHVISQINGALDSEGLMPFMNKEISRLMTEFQTGNRPFTPQDYRNLQSMLSREMSKGGNEAAAAGVAARVLGSAELRAINPVGHITTPVPAGVSAQLDDFLSQPGQAIDAVNRARAATRAAYEFEGSTPLVRQVLGDARSADPQKIASSYIIGGSLREAREVAGHVGQSPVIKDAIVAHLKDKALNSHADEVGKFSESAYNKALEAIGDKKLELFFSPEEVAQLKAVGRVASYIQSQPVGSAVNNSNSATTLLGKGLDMVGSVARLPVHLLKPAINGFRVDIGTRQAQNVVPGLLADVPSRKFLPGLLAPAAAYGGLLAAPD